MIQTVGGLTLAALYPSATLKIVGAYCLYRFVNAAASWCRSTRPQLNRERVQFQPAPEVAIQVEPQEELSHQLLAQSLISYIEEVDRRRFALEKESVLLSKLTPPQDKRELLEVPEGECCALMCGEIPPGCAIKIHDSFFDVRYFVKAMMTQDQPISPYTKNPLEANEMAQITEILGIDSEDFEKIWKWAEEYMPLFKQYGEHIVEANRSSLLGNIPQEMAAARALGRIDQYNALADQVGRIVSMQINEGLKEIKPKAREGRFIQLLELAVLRQKITSEFSKSVQEALKV